MLSAQEMYGPHHEANWSREAIALGWQLFRILPEDTWDGRPVCSSDGNLVLVADIRLDNRDELNISAECARTMCDARLLLTAFKRWGEAVVNRPKARSKSRRQDK